MTAFYGTDQWQTILSGRREAALSATEAREEYVNLYRWRLETVLDYWIASVSSHSSDRQCGGFQDHE